MKKTIISIISLAVVVIAGVGAYFLTRSSSPKTPVPHEQAATTTPPRSGGEQTGGAQDSGKTSVIGKSVEGRDITAYQFGNGDTKILFVGGLHGGYEWNTTLVAYELMDYLAKTQGVIPAKVQVTVIPVVNPDGLVKVVGTAGRFAKADVSSSTATQISGRFNANRVDLNRNFDCDWQSAGKWQKTAVSGGGKAFSEPESQSIQAYVEANHPSAVIVWYSAAGGVFSSNCNAGVSAETRALTNLFATASGYPAHESFDFYETTGDMPNWLAKKNIPAISVLLSTHEDTEWAKNQKGIEALLLHYAK